MKKLIRKLWKDEDGFIISIELVLIATILVIGLVAGMAELRDQINAELADVGGAIGGLDQSYAISGETAGDGSGSLPGGWADAVDTYDVLTGTASDAGTPGLTVATATAVGAEGLSGT